MEVKAFDDELLYLSVHEDGVLYHCDRNGNTQVVIPRNLVSMVLRMMHNDLGHIGFRKTLQRTKEMEMFRKCPSKMKTGARNVKSVSVEETRSPLKEPRSSLSLLIVDPGSWSQWTLLSMHRVREDTVIV